MWLDVRRQVCLDSECQIFAAEDESNVRPESKETEEETKNQAQDKGISICPVSVIFYMLERTDLSHFLSLVKNLDASQEVWTRSELSGMRILMYWTIEVAFLQTSGAKISRHLSEIR